MTVERDGLLHRRSLRGIFPLGLYQKALRLAGTNQVLLVAS